MAQNVRSNFCERECERCSADPFSSRSTRVRDAVLSFCPADPVAVTLVPVGEAGELKFLS